MGFKEQFKRSCSGIKKTVSGFTDTVKLEYKKGQLKNELSELYETLGQVRYSEILDGGVPSDESARLCEEIARVKAELDALEVKEPEANKCAVCGKKLPDDISYCPYCGTKTENKD